jgi:hypothetical protein
MIPRGVVIAVAVMLVVGALPMPYGYYTLLRIVACGLFGFLAYDIYIRGGKVLPWVFGFMAVLFNPLIKIHLPKEVWIFIDVVSAAALVATLKYTSPKEETPKA